MATTSRRPAAADFARRLAAALRQSGYAQAGPSRLAREFNLRHHGRPVTSQAARKWLAGAAVPSHDKLRALSEWLQVEPQWLLFGESAHGARPAARQEPPPYRVDAAALVRRIDLLSDAHRRMVVEIVLALLRLEGSQ